MIRRSECIILFRSFEPMGVSVRASSAKLMVSEVPLKHWSAAACRVVVCVQERKRNVVMRVAVKCVRTRLTENKLIQINGIEVYAR